MTAKIGPPEVVFQADVLRSRRVACFPDGNVAYRWPPTVGRATPIFYGSAGGVMARLDQQGGVAKTCPPARGLPDYYRYAAGAGGIVTNPLDGLWLCVAHCERAAPSSPNLFWGNLCLVTSRDYGQSWDYLGVIIEPALPYSDPMPAVGEIGGGALVWKGEYLLCYFRETAVDGSGRAGAAYCAAYDVFREAAAGRVAPWRKWGGGQFPDVSDPPAVGGGLAAQRPGLPAESDWESAAYVADRRLFVDAVCPFAQKRISLWQSGDGLAYSPLSAGPVTDEPGYCYYPTLVGSNPDERFVLSDGLCLYYVWTPHDPFGWQGQEQYRRRLVRF